MRFDKLLLILILIISFQLGYSQTVSVKGVVSGLGMDDVKLLKKLKKNIDYEGSLSDVRVQLSAPGYSKIVNTKLDGEFDFSAKAGKKYLLTISKRDYCTLFATLDLRDAPRTAQVNLGSLHFLLQKGDKANYKLGTLKFYKKKFVYAANKSETPTNIEDINVKTLEKASKIATYRYKSVKPSIEADQENIKDTLVTEVVQETSSAIDVIKRVSENIQGVLQFDSVDQLDTNQLASILADARNALKELEVNSAEYNLLLSQIELAESKLQDAKEIIKLKDSEISEHKKVILYSVLFSITLVLIIGLLYYFMRELKAKKAEIHLKNTRIMSSLEYASLIQKALLNSANDIGSYFSESFIYYKPKEIVSGDFYWFKKVGDKVVVAASDCTGHGVPGALLTMLGISALERIVGEQHDVEPSSIIKKLDADVSKNLADGNPFQLNGMDISIIVIDKTKKTLSYCGAMREIAISNSSGEVKLLEPEKASIASGRVKAELLHKDIPLSSSDTVVLFSDGYQDQFKGGVKDIQTYNHQKFIDLLAKIGQQKSLSETNQMLEKDINAWKKDAAQTDDLMVIGLRI